MDYRPVIALYLLIGNDKSFPIYNNFAKEKSLIYRVMRLLYRLIKGKRKHVFYYLTIDMIRIRLYYNYTIT